MWSRDAKRRAMWYGSSNVVLAVATRPTRLVAIASADSRVSGSNEVAVALRRSADMGMFSTARWSAMKKASKRPRSSVWIRRIKSSRLKLASGQAPGIRHQAVWMPTGRMKAPRWSCLVMDTSRLRHGMTRGNGRPRMPGKVPTGHLGTAPLEAAPTAAVSH